MLTISLSSLSINWRSSGILLWWEPLCGRLLRAAQVPLQRLPDLDHAALPDSAEWVGAISKILSDRTRHA